MRLGHALLGAGTLVLLALCVLLTLDRVLVPTATVAEAAIVFVPYAVVGYLACLLLATWLRRRPSRSGVGAPRRFWTAVAVVALVGVGLHAAWLAPAYVGRHPSQKSNLTVMQLNTRFGSADPEAVARLAAARQADVVVLEELNQRAAPGFVDGGLGRALPHRWGDPQVGTMVFSRWPLRHGTQVPISKGAVRVRVDAPKPFWVLGLHTTEPLSDTVTWLRDLREVRQEVGQPHGRGIVVGDFNATLDHGPMRRLLAGGLRDAAQAGNAGFQPTWPSDNLARVLGIPIPFSIFTLDHVLVTAHIGVVSTQTFTVAGTDHKALVARLVLS